MRAGRLRSRVRIHRPREVRGALGETVTAHDAVASAWVQMGVPERRLLSYGAGELPDGSVGLETHGAVDLRARDVVEVLAGPEAGTRWTVQTTHRPGTGQALAVLAVHAGPIEAAAP